VDISQQQERGQACDYRYWSEDMFRTPKKNTSSNSCVAETSKNEGVGLYPICVAFLIFRILRLIRL
jgi:hypothetical protein